MRYQDIVAQMKQLSLDEQLALLEELARSLRAELTPPRHIDSPPEQLRGALNAATNAPINQDTGTIQRAGAPLSSMWQLWARGRTLRSVQDIEPRLASWDKHDHPSQVRLRSYLTDLMMAIMPLPMEDVPLFLHLSVDVQQPKRLVHHYDLENYLTPLFGKQWLDASRFMLVSADKHVGEGSTLEIGIAESLTPSLDGLEHFSCVVDRGPQTTPGKAAIRDMLAAAQPRPLPEGPVAVQLAWRCGPQCNWVSFWKPTGDAMGPVLGEAYHDRIYNPRDDRIVALTLHHTIDPTLKHNVAIGMWWRNLDIPNDAL